MKAHPIRKLYDTCSRLVEELVIRRPAEWKVGGENIVVLVDFFPSGCNKLENTCYPHSINNNSTEILCIAEAKVRCLKTLCNVFYLHKYLHKN